jgi:hypothetical protein
MNINNFEYQDHLKETELNEPVDGLEDSLPDVYEVFFQFDEEEPIKMAYVAGTTFSLTLEASKTEIPTIVFADGKGKEFKFFMKKDNEDNQ